MVALAAIHAPREPFPGSLCPWAGMARRLQEGVDWVEARPEQYVVVGKTGLGDDSGDALILVIKARLVD